MLFAILTLLTFGIQNLGCKEYGRRFPDTMYSQSVMTAASQIIVVVIMAALGGARMMPAQGFILAALFGLMFVVTLSTMTLALSLGHMGVTLLIQNSSLIVPVIYGMLVWNEQMTVPKGIGIACVLLMLVLSAGDLSAKDGESSAPGANKGRWLICLALAFIGDSVLAILQGTVSRECASLSPVTFTFWTSVFSVLFAALLTVWFRLRGCGGLLPDRKSRVSFGLICAAIGAGTAGGNCFTIMAGGNAYTEPFLRAIPSTVLFPMRSGGLVLMMWALGILIYREKVSRRGIWMLIVGLAGLVLLNL